MSQFLICQQDNYNGVNNCVADFLLTLYTNFKNDKFYYIFHDKEKDVHCHVILITSLDYTKSELLKLFPYADIQYQRANNKNAYKYLSHQTKKCIRENKLPYDEKDIITNNIDDEFHLKWLDTQREKAIDLQDEREILDFIVDDIINGIIKDFNECLRKYKGVALKYSRSIKETLNSF